MQSRRRWISMAVIVLAGAVTPGVLLAAGDLAARDPAADAASLKKLQGGDAVTLRQAVIDNVTKMGIVDKNNFVKNKLLPAFEPLLSSDNPDAVINTAIIIAESHTLACDAELEKMLTDTNPAVRYWGAKGLGEIMGDIKSVGGFTFRRALDALNKALNVEKSGVIKNQIIHALGLAQDAGAVLKASRDLADQIQKSDPDHETIDAATTALGQLNELIHAGATVDKTTAAEVAADIASYTAQRQARLQDVLTRQGAGDVPEDYRLSVTNAVKAAILVLNDLVGRNAFRVPDSTKPDEFELAVNKIVGTPSVPGDLHKLIPGVKAPEQITPVASTEAASK